jgi:DNA-binding NarL/FixJ family response regulator
VAIAVLFAEDSVIREGVPPMLLRDCDLEVVGLAGDYGSLVGGAEAAHPAVVESGIRLAPTFQHASFEAAMEIRDSDTGVVILSHFDDRDRAVTLLSEGSAGSACLLNDCIADSTGMAR